MTDLQRWARDLMADMEVEGLSAAAQALHLWLLVNAARSESQTLGPAFCRQNARILQSKRGQIVLGLFWERVAGPDAGWRKASKGRGLDSLLEPSPKPDLHLASSGLASGDIERHSPLDEDQKSTSASGFECVDGWEELKQKRPESEAPRPASLLDGASPGIESSKISSEAAEAPERRTILDCGPDDDEKRGPSEAEKDRERVYNRLMVEYGRPPHEIEAWVEAGMTEASLDEWAAWRAEDPTRGIGLVISLIRRGHLSPKSLNPQPTNRLLNADNVFSTPGSD